MKQFNKIFAAILLLFTVVYANAADYSTSGYTKLSSDQTINATSDNCKFYVAEGSSVNLNFTAESGLDTLYVIAEGTIDFGYLPSSTPLKLIIGTNGSVNYSTSVNYQKSYTINYSDNFTCTYINSASTLLNNADITFASGLSINGNGATFINRGTVTITGDLTNSGNCYNDGPMTISGSCSNNGGSTLLQNNCSIEISKDFTTSGIFNMGDNAYMEVLGTTTCSGGSGTFGVSAYLKTNELYSYCSYTGPDSGYAAIQYFTSPIKSNTGTSYPTHNLYFINKQNEVLTGYTYQGAQFSGTATFTFPSSGDCSPGYTPEDDGDGDGVPDDEDAFPNDSTKAYISYYPSEDTWGTLMFEDNWPNAGDYDMNDLVANYQYAVITNADNEVVTMTVDYNIEALGADYENGFGFTFPIANSLIESVTGTDSSNSTTVNSNGTETTSDADEATIIVCDNLSRYGSMVNVEESQEGSTSTITDYQITINFTDDNGLTYDDLINTDEDKGINPFIYIGQNRGREVHLAGYSPTSQADTSLFGTGSDDEHDATDTSEDYTYKSVSGYPWALDVPEEIGYLLETVDFNNGYPNFATWVTSGGTTDTDWYDTTDSSVLFQGSAE